jgi:hypothetical protein
MVTTAPPIYAPRLVAVRHGPGARILAAFVVVGCAAILGIALRLEPSPTGLGTHSQLGLQGCQFLHQTGLACPSCGMTTSFAYFVRGNIAASTYVQPMGAVLALGTAGAFWVGLYIAATGRPALRLLQIIPARYYVMPLMVLALAAWGWKIWTSRQV